jgi:hypothetical protein
MEPTSIPKQYGGQLEWQWGDMPNLDEPSRELLRGLEQPLADGQTRKDILKGPVLFEGDHLRVLGTVDGKERRETIAVPKTQALNGSAAAVTSEAEKEDSEKVVDNVADKVHQLSVDETKNTVAA